jgi:hypothetical protein
MSVEHFRRRAQECRRLAINARNPGDKGFWLGLVERWHALEIQKAQQPIRDKPRTPRPQSVDDISFVEPENSNHASGLT